MSSSLAKLLYLCRCPANSLQQNVIADPFPLNSLQQQSCSLPHHSHFHTYTITSEFNHCQHCTIKCISEFNHCQHRTIKCISEFIYSHLLTTTSQWSVSSLPKTSVDNYTQIQPLIALRWNVCSEVYALQSQRWNSIS